MLTQWGGHLSRLCKLPFLGFLETWVHLCKGLLSTIGGNEAQESPPHLALQCLIGSPLRSLEDKGWKRRTK